MKAQSLEQKNKKRKQILKAAEKLFSEKNYGNTQISEIAKHAGVGIGTFYRHFPDKDSVLRELVETLMLKIRGEFAEVRAGIEQLSPIEHITQFRKGFEVFLNAMLSKPKLTLIFLRSGYGANGEVSDLVWKTLNLFAEDIITDIQRVEETGLIKVQDKESISHCIIGMVLQLVHKIIIDGKPTQEQAINICLRSTLGILGAFLPNEQLNKLAPVYLMLLPPINDIP